MPDLRTRPRRGFKRQIPPVLSDSSLSDYSKLQRTRRRLLYLVLAIFFTYFAYQELSHRVFDLAIPLLGEDSQGQYSKEELQSKSKDESNQESKSRSKSSSKSPSSGRRASKGKRRTILASRELDQVKSALKRIVPLIHRIEQEPTKSYNFHSRLSRFKSFMDALPASDARSLFPMMDSKAMEELYSEKPERACALLDKLIERIKILMP